MRDKATGVGLRCRLLREDTVHASEAYIRLNAMTGVGPVGVRALADALGGVARIFEARPDELAAVPGVRKQVVQRIVGERASLDIDAERARAEETGVRILTLEDEEYPDMLRTVHDPPLALYVRGRFASSDARAIAVVGTRSPSQYGRDMASRLASQLARAGVTVVSGLARGVDTAAHRGALEGGGRTIAFLGSGLASPYPRENAGLADEVAAQGAVVSEFGFDRKPDRTTFAIRNRLVSGLSQGVLVVEAGVASGAMITADAAAEQGRTVFAVPGRIDNPRVRGPHRLIKQGATLVESVDDILEEFAFLPFARKAEPKPEDPAQSLAGEERVVWDALAEGELPVDALIRKTELAPARVNALLVGLEMKRIIRMLPGRIVTRR